MSWFPLVIFVVVTVGLQDVNSQRTNRLIHCKTENTRHQCARGPGPRISNSGSVWDPTYEDYLGEDAVWNCTPCCQFSGTTIPLCNSDLGTIRGINGRRKRGIEKKEEESIGGGNHCQMIHTSHQCIPGPGKRFLNTGTVWDPSQSIYIGDDERWNCTACCQFPEKSIPQCEDSSKNATTRQNTGEMGDIEGESFHCQLSSVTQKCSPGPGRRIINRCDEWDPACEEDAGEDPYWNCLPCCLEKDKSLRHCDENMKILK